MKELPLKVLEAPLKKLFNRLGKELEQIMFNKLLEYQTIEHKKNLFSKTILYRVSPKLLKEFYQPLFIEKTKDTKIPTHSISDLFDKENYITIIGNAGSGKSTLIKYLFINCIEENYKIPIKLELRYLNDYKGSITDYIINEIFGFFQLGLSTTKTESLLLSGDFVFFFDGYDELNSSIITQTTKDIDSFVTKYNSNNYIITSRPYTNIDLLSLFTNYKICSLSSIEIEEFILKQDLQKEVTEKINKSITNDTSKGTASTYTSFLSNPLLLSMFILTFQSYSELPTKRTDFYAQVFETLFSIHDSFSKLAFVREKESGLSKEQFEEVLTLFSFLSYFSGQFTFKISYLKTTLNEIKEKKTHLRFDNDKIIKDLQVSINILSKDGLDYTFPHRSLQEYFAALYLLNISDSIKSKLYKKLINKIEQDLSYLISNRNFFSMLLELDREILIKQLFLPIFEKQLKILKKEKDISLYSIYHYMYVFKILYSYLLSEYRGNVKSNISSILYLNNIELKKEHTHLEHYRQIWYNMYSPNNTIFTEDMFKGENVLKIGREKIKDLIIEGTKIVKDLKNEILDNKKSDLDIIDILD